MKFLLLLIQFLCFLTLSTSSNDINSTYVPSSYYFEYKAEKPFCFSLKCIEFSNFTVYNFTNLFGNSVFKDSAKGISITFNYSNKHPSIEVIKNSSSTNSSKDNYYYDTPSESQTNLFQANFSNSNVTYKINLVTSSSSNTSERNMTCGEDNNSISCTVFSNSDRVQYGVSFIICQYSGIFGYFSILIGLSNLVYGYNNETYLFITYGIVFFFHFFEDIAEHLCYYGVNFKTAISILFVAIFVIAGGLYGIYLGSSVWKRKIMIAYFFGKIISLIFFYSFWEIFFQKEDYIAWLEVLYTIIILSEIICLAFYNVEKKQLNMLTYSAIGSFILIKGMNILGGGLTIIPFLYELNESMNDNENLKKAMYDYKSLIFYLVTFIASWVFGILITNFRREDKESYQKDQKDSSYLRFTEEDDISSKSAK